MFSESFPHPKSPSADAAAVVNVSERKCLLNEWKNQIIHFNKNGIQKYRLSRLSLHVKINKYSTKIYMEHRRSCYCMCMSFTATVNTKMCIFRVIPEISTFCTEVKKFTWIQFLRTHTLWIHVLISEQFLVTLVYAMDGAVRLAFWMWKV